MKKNVVADLMKQRFSISLDYVFENIWFMKINALLFLIVLRINMFSVIRIDFFKAAIMFTLGQRI